MGTPALKPYMHGYFISLKLYDTARLIANPFAYEDHREKQVRDKMDKLAETRIRAKKEVGVKVNKGLAEKILKEEERARKREERRRARKESAMEVDGEDQTVEEEAGENQAQNVLSDPRFAKVFENAEFAIDENSREYALLNPSAAAQKKYGGRGKTAVEDEEEESDKVSSDGLGRDSESEDEGSASDSSDAGGSCLHLCFSENIWLTCLCQTELNAFDPRVRPGQKNPRAQEAYNRTKESNRITNAKVNFVPMRALSNASKGVDKNATFGQRRKPVQSVTPFSSKRTQSQPDDSAMEISWVPSSSANQDANEPQSKGGREKKERRKGVETFGAGMEKGGQETLEISESDRMGRTDRRKGVRSGSKNVFRAMDS